VIPSKTEGYFHANVDQMLTKPEASDDQPGFSKGARL
jgi:hypothetical protein